jgi:hypothetical protein
VEGENLDNCIDECYKKYPVETEYVSDSKYFDEIVECLMECDKLFNDVLFTKEYYICEDDCRKKYYESDPDKYDECHNECFKKYVKLLYEDECVETYYSKGYTYYVIENGTIVKEETKVLESDECEKERPYSTY